MKYSKNGYETGLSTYPKAIDPTHSNVRAMMYPSMQRNRSSVNTVMWGGDGTIEVSRGTRSAWRHDREGDWHLYCQTERAETECGSMPNMIMASAKFELDYNDGSNGKLNFVYSVNNKKRKKLIVEGLTGDYVWVGVIGVYYKGVTTMEISSG